MNPQIFWRGQPVQVLSYEPLISGMCDASIQLEDGSTLAVSSNDLKFEDGSPAYCPRHEVKREADVEALRSLKAIREKHIQDFSKPWPGLEHGKAIFGNSVNKAIEEVQKRVSRE